MKKVMLVFAVGVLVAAASTGARASVVYSNLSAGEAVVYNQGGPGELGESFDGPMSGPFRVAFSFLVTGNIDYRFDGARLALMSSSGNNAIGLVLYTDAGGSPGSALEADFATAAMPTNYPTNDTLVVFDSVTHPLLVHGQRYWLLPLASGNTEAQWSYNVLSSEPESGPIALSTEVTPGDWSVDADQLGAFQVNGSAVPEPATIVLWAWLGVVAGLGAWRRRRMG